MQKPANIFHLLLAVTLILALPYIGGLIKFDGVFPTGFFEFPVLQPIPKEPFNLTVFIVLSIVAFAILMVYLFPRLFGWKKVEIPKKEPVKKVSFPIWFWIGLVLWGTTFTINTLVIDYPKIILNWSAIPLFWGFAFMLDGWVYVRQGGKSMISKHPQATIGIGVSGISGWLIFEYLNFFVDDNWFYPKADLIGSNEFVIYAVLGSSGLLIPTIIIYHLLTTFDWLNFKYKNGPKISLSPFAQNIVLAVALGGLFLTSFFPDQLFTILWFAPLIILLVVLEKMKVWTPVTPIKNGDWSYTALTALSYLIFGFLLECWNYLSGTHDGGELVTYCPDYWVYSIPYVSVFHVFEMPILGFVGYLPFGVYCAVWWITFSTLLNIPTNFKENGY